MKKWRGVQGAKVPVGQEPEEIRPLHRATYVTIRRDQTRSVEAVE